MNKIQEWAVTHKGEIVQCYKDANSTLIDGSIYWDIYIIIDLDYEGVPSGCSTFNVNVNDAYRGNGYVWDIVYGNNAVTSYDLVHDALQKYGSYMEYFERCFNREVNGPKNCAAMSVDDFKSYAMEVDGLSEEQWEKFVKEIEAGEIEWFCEGEGAMDGYESAFSKAFDYAGHYVEEGE